MRGMGIMINNNNQTMKQQLILLPFHVPVSPWSKPFHVITNYQITSWWLIQTMTRTTTMTMSTLPQNQPKQNKKRGSMNPIPMSRSGIRFYSMSNSATRPIIPSLSTISLTHSIQNQSRVTNWRHCYYVLGLGSVWCLFWPLWGCAIAPGTNKKSPMRISFHITCHWTMTSMVMGKQFEMR